MKNHKTLAISFCCFLAFLSHAIAQQPTPTPTPSAAKPPFQMPDMSAMYSQMMSAMFTELTRPERATQLAKFQRQYYEALIKEGFTKEEALNIVKATQLPFAGTK